MQNKPEVVKCVACDTAKPGTGVKPALTRPPVSDVSLTPPAHNPATTSSNTTTSGFSFADKFKKPEGAWDCEVCMVQNKAQDIKCIACQSAKPGMFIYTIEKLSIAFGNELYVFVFIQSSQVHRFLYDLFHINRK